MPLTVITRVKFDAETMALFTRAVTALEGIDTSLRRIAAPPGQRPATRVEVEVESEPLSTP